MASASATANMQNDPANMQVQNVYGPKDQEEYVPLSFILETAIQRTHHDLFIMADM